MNTLQIKPDYDFVIVGARVAGAATARLLAHAGARVLVLDRGMLGSDTLSTSYLMRGAVQQLHRWGILPQVIAAGTPPVRTTHFHYASRTVSVDIRPAHGVDALYAPRRTLLDPLLASAAQTAGAELRFGARVTGLLRRGDRVTGVELAQSPTRSARVTAGMVIGADGLPSSVARWVEAETYRTGSFSAPTIYSYFERMPVDGYNWYYAHGLAAGAAPTNDGLTTVFVAAPPHRLPELYGDRHAGMLRIAAEVSPAFGQALAAARRASALRVFPGARGYYRKPWGPGWALVGDAGYFRDPDTAHGISDALRDAELLANALLAGDEPALARYHSVRDAATERLFHASDELAGGHWDEARVEHLLREASEGMRDGMQVVHGFAASADHEGASISSADHRRSIGMPASRFATRTESRSGA
jgi:2-polyprenyl-6-methoxyphenol hydroxylase-like FAD-dependent oxidoreductase